jgi:hypothetical protein
MIHYPLYNVYYTLYIMLNIIHNTYYSHIQTFILILLHVTELTVAEHDFMVTFLHPWSGFGVYGSGAGGCAGVVTLRRVLWQR